MDMYHQDIKEAEEKIAGEMLAENLLQILAKIATTEPGVIKWVEHEIESELLRNTAPHRDTIIEMRMFSDLSSYMNGLFTSKMTA